MLSLAENSSGPKPGCLRRWQDGVGDSPAGQVDHAICAAGWVTVAKVGMV